MAGSTPNEEATPVTGLTATAEAFVCPKSMDEFDEYVNVAAFYNWLQREQTGTPENGTPEADWLLGQFKIQMMMGENHCPDICPAGTVAT